jgi:hypothetical protein
MNLFQLSFPLKTTAAGFARRCCNPSRRRGPDEPQDDDVASDKNSHQLEKH